MHCTVNSYSVARRQAHLVSCLVDVPPVHQVSHDISVFTHFHTTSSCQHQWSVASLCVCGVGVCVCVGGRLLYMYTLCSEIPLKTHTKTNHHSHTIYGLGLAQIMLKILHNSSLQVSCIPISLNKSSTRIILQHHRRCYIIF